MSVVAPHADQNRDEVAVLASGGLDSAVLVADFLRQGRVTHPVYVRFGLAWEPVEEAYLRRFLDTLSQPGARPLVVLNSPIADVYGSHWSVSGQEVPDDRSVDEAVYLPGRNLLLLAMPSVWCALHDVHTVALGTLKGNPFPDATPEFFDGFASLARRAMGHALEVVTPFASLTKSDVVELGRGLALQHTLSCIDPNGERHCGRCNKCAERRHAFSALQIEDLTEYAQW
ncbi:MAG: 7-cyano-7-deazaguanine synthase [Acidimicrobiales bacterium]